MRVFLLIFVFGILGCTPREAPIVLQPLEPEVKVVKITDVRVELVQGPAVPMAKLLSSAVAAGLIDHGVTSSIRQNEISRYVLKGVAEANWNDRRVPFVMLIHWSLYDMTGETLGTYTQGVKGARWKWEYGDPRIIRAVGNGAAKPLAAMIVDDVDEPLPSLLLGAGVLVDPVTGAPGDGNQALYREIITALNKADVSITEDRRQAKLILSGQVGVQSQKDGRDRVLIIWRVSTLDGFEVGRATQENFIPSGKLGGTWGAEAASIAEAAVVGIERILGSSAARRGPSVIDPGVKPPVTPELEQVPGRAPPPPNF